MRDRQPFLTRWGLCVLPVTATALALALLAARGPSYPYWAEMTVAALSFSVVGALVVSRPGGDLIGWLLVAIGSCAASLHLLGEYAVVGHTSLPDSAVAAWLSNLLLFVFFSLTLAILPLLFPDGRLPSRRWWPVALLVGIGTAIALVGAALVPGPMEAAGGPLPGTNPFGIRGAGWLRAVGGAGFAAVTMGAVLSAAGLVARYRRADETGRLQLKWLAYGGAWLLAATVVLPAVLNPFASGPAIDAVESAAVAVALAGLMVAVGMAILRHRLYEIDVLINRSLVYALLTGLLVAVYALIVAGLAEVFRHRADFGASLLGAAIVAAGFQPLRQRLQRGIDHLMYGRAGEPYAVMSSLGQRLEEALAPPDVLVGLVETVAEALQATYVAIELSQPEGFETGARHGRPTEAVVRFPLTYQSEVVGRLVVAERRPGEHYGQRDLRLLEDLARQAGVATHAARVTAALQRSRERLVTAREEERRRLRRSLHDGLGPSLAGMALEIEAARNVLSRDPVAAEQLLAKLRAEAQDAIDEVRRVVYDLRPPSLDQLGLVHALREQADRFGAAGTNGDGLFVTVESAGEFDLLPAAVEVAVYRIAVEAMTNVVRHAHARTCSIRLIRDDAVVLEVADDGWGLPEVVRPGVGLDSMRERAMELGGSFEVMSGPGEGTTVRVRLPVAA